MHPFGVGRDYEIKRKFTDQFTKRSQQVTNEMDKYYLRDVE